MAVDGTGGVWAVKRLLEQQNEAVRLRLICDAVTRVIIGFGTIIGASAVVHAIWAVAFVAVTWILVVLGWRG